MTALQPPNLRLNECRFGERCTICRNFEVRDERFWCVKYDLNVRDHDLCDDYVRDGMVRVA